MGPKPHVHKIPTIVFVSPKGGAGKTTSALVLAIMLEKIGEVSVIDADPNRPIAKWATGGDAPKGMSIISDIDENNIADKIDEAATRTPFVVVDLEGTAAKIVVMAVSRADLIIIPTQGSNLDAAEAGKAINVVRQQEKSMRRAVPDYELPYRILLTRTNPVIRARTLMHVQKTFLDSGIPLLETEMHEREAFRAMFSFRKAIESLDKKDVPNIDKAIDNAKSLASEVVGILKDLQRRAV